MPRRAFGYESNNLLLCIEQPGMIPAVHNIISENSGFPDVL
jgi:hypothetical protein